MTVLHLKDPVTDPIVAFAEVREIRRVKRGDYNSGTPSGVFAGHTDWRLPTIFELRTLKDPNVPGCGSGSPCIIDPIFNAAPGVYWSSTPFGLSSAYDLDFGRIGGLDFEGESGPNYVRAVRTAF